MSYTSRTFSTAKKSFDAYNLVYLTWSRYEDDWSSTMHFHAFTEFIYVVGGEGTLQLDGGSKKLRGGDLVIINPSTPHTETSQSVNSLEYYIFAIENIALTPARPDGEEEPVRMFNVDDIDDRRHLLAVFRRAESELIAQKPHYEVLVQSLINEVMVYILRKTGAQHAQHDALAVPHECAFIKQYIDAHYSDKITLDDIAQKTFFNKYYIIHSFKKQYGITPIQYLLDTRLSMAARLLETTNLSITGITANVGFSSPSQLAKAFKEKYGVPPLRFRAAIAAGEAM